MQEEVNNGAAQVVVKVGKLSGRLLKAAVAKVLKAWQEKSDPQKLHRGKQTVKQLAAQNKGMSSIDVDKAGKRRGFFHALRGFPVQSGAVRPRWKYTYQPIFIAA